MLWSARVTRATTSPCVLVQRHARKRPRAICAGPGRVYRSEIRTLYVLVTFTTSNVLTQYSPVM